MKTILLIEDDKEIGSFVKEDFEYRGFAVTWVISGENIEEFLHNVDVVILDVMLPRLDGFTVGQRVKRTMPHIPILMLSARTSVDDKLEGLRFADDYMTKPFHPDELAARIEVLLRRQESHRPEMMKVGHLHINLKENRIVSAAGEEIILTAKQYQIFSYLLTHPNQIMTKEQLYEGVWNEPYINGDKTLMVHIRYLRERIEKDPGNPAIIETIRGIGYRVKQ